jgi:hypothetical protein
MFSVEKIKNMNVHVPKKIAEKYPHIEFRGKPKSFKNRTIIEAYNPAVKLKLQYSFEEDFFWFSGQIPDYILNIT